MAVRSSPLALALLLAACGPTSPPEPGPLPPRPVTADPSAEAPEAAPEPAAAPVPVQVVYNLAAHADHAERREGKALLIDFGTRAAEKYTLGGFRTGTSSGAYRDTGVLFVRDRAGRVTLPTEQGATTLLLRAKALSSGSLALYVDEQPLTVTESESSDGYRLLRATLPADLRPGEHELLIRTPRATAVSGVGAVGAVVDWLRVGPAEGLSSEAPAPLASFTEGGATGLVIKKGSALGYAAIVPTGALFRGVVRGEGGLLRVVAHRDGHAPETLSEAGPGALELKLDALAGQLVRFDFVAEGADVELIAPILATPETATKSAPAPLKNVVVYLIDTLRADKLSPYNAATRVQTPGLTKFLEGATVLNARSHENWTKPSVASLLSSLLPWQHTATGGDSVLPASVEILPEMLDARGYRTGSFIANGYVSDRFGFKQGWDSYRNYIREELRTGAEYVAADALRWLDARNETEPFFLYVHTIDPHVPYRPPTEFLAMYGDPDYRGPVNFRSNALMLEDIKGGRVPLAARDKAHLEALYDGEISYHDVHFASILAKLEERGFADDTLVVVTADHGEEFWDHGSVGHGHSVYDELLHVPLFIRHPGIEGRIERIDRPVGLVDVVPTVLESLGMPVPEGIAGRSLLPDLLGATPDAPRPVVSGFLENYRTLLLGQLKLHQRARAGAVLYDLASDPGETRDLAAERPIATRYMRGQLGLTLADSEVGETQSSSRPRPQRHQQEHREIDPETAAQLRALGYIH